MANPKLKTTSDCINCRKIYQYRPSQEIGRFCSLQCQHDFVWLVRKAYAEETGDLETLSTTRRYLIEKNGWKCVACDLDEWQGKPVPLVCDHINGNSSDWSIRNVQMICCNCDAQTPFYKAKNKGNGRHSRRERYRAGLSF
jgi:hypothetical protein